MGKSGRERLTTIRARSEAGIVINQTLNVGQGVSRNEVASAMVAAKDAAKAEILALDAHRWHVARS